MAGINDAQLPAPGAAFYYVLRAQTQLNVTSYGTAQRDAEAAVSANPCTVLFP